MHRLFGAASLAVLIAATVAASSAAPSGGRIWLDAAHPRNWNAAGGAIPRAPRVDRTMNARCARAGLVRTAASLEDRAVSAAGWTLFNKAQRSGSTIVVLGQAGFDGMCRPLRYQGFVFSAGRFAGTLSPNAMPSRALGSMQVPSLASPTRIAATFDHYAPADALCCPSRLTDVTYAVGRTARGPVVAPLSARTYRSTSR